MVFMAALQVCFKYLPNNLKKANNSQKIPNNG